MMPLKSNLRAIRKPSRSKIIDLITRSCSKCIVTCQWWIVHRDMILLSHVMPSFVYVNLHSSFALWCAYVSPLFSTVWLRFCNYLKKSPSCVLREYVRYSIQRIVEWNKSLHKTNMSLPSWSSRAGQLSNFVGHIICSMKTWNLTCTSDEGDLTCILLLFSMSTLKL